MEGNSMLNERKIRLMSELAAMEKKQGKELRDAAGYYRSDYIAKHLMQNGWRLTLAYLFGAGLYAIYQFINLPDGTTLEEYIEIGIWMLAVYFFVLCIGLLITYLQSLKDYFRVQKEMQKYQVLLERLSRENEEDMI